MSYKIHLHNHSVVEWLESLASNPVTYLACIRSSGDILFLLFFWRGRKESSIVPFQERWLGNYPPT